MFERLRRVPLWWFGLALLAVQLISRWWFVRDGYFWQDDFAYLSDVRQGLSWEILLQDYNDHLMPGSFLLSWLVTITGTTWGVALLILLVLQLVAGLALLWVIQLLFPGRVLGLAVYAAALFTPLTMVGVGWWAYGIQLWPLQLTFTAMIGCYVMWSRTHQFGWAVGIVAAYVGGLFFWEKALLGVPVLLGFSALLWHRDRVGATRLRRLRAQWPLWAALGVVTVGYLAVYLSRVSLGGGEARTSSPQLGSFLDNGLLRTLLPGLLGGPWTAKGSVFTLGATPHVLAVVASALIWAAIIGLSILLRRAAAVQAWGWLVLCLALDFGLLALFRPDADVLVRDARYIADLVPIVAIAILAAFYPTAADAEADPVIQDDDPVTARVSWRSASVAAPVIAVGLLASSTVSTAALADGLRHSYSRNYVESMARLVRDDGSRPLLDWPAPSQNVFYGMQSRLAQAMDVRPTWTSAAQDMGMFDAIGRVWNVEIREPEVTRRGPISGCGWLVRPDQPVRLDLPELDAWRGRVVQIGYLSQRVHDLSVSVDGARMPTVATQDGLGVVTVRVQAPRELLIQVERPGAAVCVSDVTVGPPSPNIDP